MPTPSLPTVVLLHGLGRTARSMAPLARRIERAGFRTANPDYPSTCHPIETLVAEHVRPVVERAAEDGPVHFVTHSLGGILVRAFAARHGLPAATRIVMLAPPNAGSAVADALHARWPFRRLCGPVLRELGTGDDGVPAHLDPLDAEVGVIAGDRRLYPWFTPLLGDAHDGLVAVEATRLPEMADFTVVRTGHAFIMRDRTVADETVHFLRRGRFRNGASG